MKKTKAQLSIFIVLGVLILIFLFIVFYYIYSSYASPDRLKFERSSIASYMQACVDKTSSDALKLAGRQGLYTAPKDALANVSYLLKGNLNKLPSQQAIEQDLSRYVEQHLLACLGNFAEFEQLEWSVSYEQPKASASMNLNDVSFSVSFPVNVKQQDLTISLNQFSVKQDIRLLYLYRIIEKMLATLQAEQAIDLTDMTNYNINLTVFPYQNASVYALEDPEHMISGKPYLVMFAVK
ncbi:hypothetical protein HYV81_02805 [Candidatus Woesearchaeota archaeon]|nr:hypothetical protein [Candidatus Woesearchaeota archaeon]